MLLLPNFQFIGVFLLCIGFIILTFIVRLGTAILLSSLIILYLDGINPSYQLMLFDEFIGQLNPIVFGIGFLYLSILIIGQLLVWFNYYMNIFLWRPLQKIVNCINSHLPILVWRVFTPDVVNLYCLVFEVDKIGAKRLLNKKNFTTDYGHNLFHKLRFSIPSSFCRY